jgi:predicted Zn-dependent protease
MKEVDLTVKKEDIENSKDKKEEETGIFHWKEQDGSYTPVTEMSKEDIDRARELSESRMDKLHDNIQKLHSQMHSWQYRYEKLTEALEQSTEISEEAATQQKELTE